MRTSDLLRLAGLLAATAFAGTRAARLELDMENRAMRSEGTPEARAALLREEYFGQDALLVLLLEPRPGSGMAEEVERSVATWLEGLRSRSDVQGLVHLSGARPGEELVAIQLASDGPGGIAGALTAFVRAAEESLPVSQSLSISGPPAGEAAIARALQEEQRRIVPLVLAVLMALLLSLYRSPSLALGALLPALGGIAGTGALQALLGLAVNPVTALLPPVLLAVGVASAVHLIDAYLDCRDRGLDPDGSSRSAARSILSPALGCASTTVVGFLALSISPIPAVRRFGVLSAAGVALTALLSFALLPPWLRCTARSPRLRRRAAGRGAWSRLGSRLAGTMQRRGRVLRTAALVAALFLAAAWTRLTVDTDPLRVLPATHPFRRATERIGARLGGTETFELLLEPPAPSPGPAALLGLQSRLSALDGVAGPGGPPRVASDGTALVSALLRPSGTTARETLFARAEALARELGWQRPHATGPAVQVARDSGAIARGEFLGLCATFLALGPCMARALRSLRLTALGLLANVFPCLVLHGGLALAGRPLSVASAMIGSVVLGLVVDDAIYFLHGFSAAARSGRSPRSAVARALRRSGRAITVTSLVLTLGFLASLGGSLATTREFGVLAAVSILAALAANLCLLPALVLVARPRELAPGLPREGARALELRA